MESAPASLPGPAADRRALLASMILLSLAGLALRLWLGWWMGYLGDLQCWQLWGLDPGEFERSPHYTPYLPLPKNYPPLYASAVRIMRWVHRGLGLPGEYTGRLEEQFHTDPDAWRPLILYLKLPPILSDVVTAWLLLAIATRLGRPWKGVGLAGLYLFSPAILYDGAYFGQTDTILVMFLIAAFWAYVAARPVWLGAMLMAAALMKAQSIFALLIFGPLILLQWRVWRSFLLRIAAGMLAALVLVAAAAWWTGELAQFYRGYATIIGAQPLVSVRAFNFWWLLLRPWDRAPMHFDLPRDDELVAGLVTYRTVGMVLFFSVIVVILWLLRRARGSPYAVALGLVAAGWAFFNLCTQMHERYSVPAVGLMTLLALWEPRWWWLTLTASITATLNIAQVCYLLLPTWCRPVTLLVNEFIFSERHMAWVFFAVIHILMLPLTLDALRREGRGRPGLARGASDKLL